MNIPRPDATMKRDDMATNFMQHYKAELQAFGDTHQLSLAEVMNLYSPPTEEDITDNALLDAIERKGLRTDPVGNIPASPIGEFFGKGAENALLGYEYVSEVYHENIGKGIANFEVTPLGTISEFASPSTRGNREQPFDPPTYALEVRRNYMIRVRLQHVVSRRIPISGSTYQPGIVESPNNTGIRPVAEGADLPVYRLKTGDSTTRTQKTGYALEVTREVINNANMTMDLITETQRQKAMQTENAIVNEALQTIGTNSPTAVSWAAAVTDEDIVTLFGSPDDEYAITTIIATLGGLAQYITAPIYYESSNQMGVTGGQRRNSTYLDDLMGLEKVGKKNTSDVPALTETNKDVALAFDRRASLDYPVERRSMISESDDNIMNQTVVFTNSHRYALHKKAEFNQARYRVTIG